MSDWKVPLTTIRALNPHPNPKVERLEIAKIFDFDVVVRKGEYKVGDQIFYVPVGSVIADQLLEDKLFPPDAKIKLNKKRIRAIRIQGFVSQGMAIPLKDIASFISGKLVLDRDYAEDLKIVKYEPPEIPVKGGTPGAPGQPRNKKHENPYFKKYGGLNNLKWLPDYFADGEEVVITEKIHGTNFRAGWVPVKTDTLWKKIKAWFKAVVTGKEPLEFVFGSNNVQLHEKPKTHKGYYETNVYAEAVEKYDLKKKIGPNQVVYGEIYGSGIQKNYNYECDQNEHKLVVFDLMHQEKNSHYFYDFSAVKSFCDSHDLACVPVLYQGPWTRENAEKLLSGNSVLAPSQKVREGIVIKNLGVEAVLNRKAVKWVSPEYLMREANDETTDGH